MPTDDELLAFAASIDADRAAALGRDLRKHEGSSLAVLLGTAFPPLVPHSGWQLDAVAEIAREGWRTARSRDDMLERFRSVVGNLDDADAALSRVRRAVWLDRARIALRELFPAALGGAGVEVTARELSDLAAAALQVVLAEAEQHIASRYGQPQRADGRASTLVVLGMGKLGGLELNAGSDVDLVMVYDTDDGKSELELHDHWTRVARRVVQSFEAPGEDGAIWRVDLRLRPEGSQGPIVNSVAATERYYETWGRLWERAALLRARTVAGDADLGALLEREIFVPFVYRHEVDPQIATALAELVQRSRSELSSAPERDLKLGRGGIREAEFFVQSLQLIWGGREPLLREPSTLKALGRLRSRGLVTDREARDIAWAYALLRRVEHRVQWMTGIQTHLLPESEAELGRLARSLGVENDELVSELGRARERVHSLFAALAPSAPRPPPGRRAALLFGDQPSAARELAGGIAASPSRQTPAIDVRHPEMIEHLRALAKRPDGLLGEQTRERHPDFADEVLDAVVDSADPEQAARYLRSLFGHFVSARAYISALAGDELALRRLVTALGASAYVGDAVVGWPDLADVIVFGGAQISPIPTAVAAELETFARDVAAENDAYERRSSFVSALRRAKSRITVEVAVADLAGQMGTRAATRVLSDLADAIIDRAADYELTGGIRPASQEPLGLAVIAVGKLGGRDIGYGSDLDVLFVYDPERAPSDTDPGEYFVRRAQGIIRLISEPHPAGRGYELDTRLRPSGSHGLLVTSIESFARYHGVTLDPKSRPVARPSVLASGAPWERQALVRARFCGGDRQLGERVIEVAHIAAYEREAPAAAEVHRLRLRMQQELARERPPERYDLKLGYGGLLDIEFLAQWLMQHGKDPRVRTTDTAQALDALASTGYLDRADRATLRDAYGFLRRLEQRIHVLHGSGSTVIDVNAPGLAPLARRMDFQDGARVLASDQLVERYRDVTGAVRAVYSRVLGPSAD